MVSRLVTTRLQRGKTWVYNLVTHRLTAKNLEINGWFRWFIPFGLLSHLLLFTNFPDTPNPFGSHPTHVSYVSSAAQLPLEINVTVPALLRNPTVKNSDPAVSPSKRKWYSPKVEQEKTPEKWWLKDHFTFGKVSWICLFGVGKTPTHILQMVVNLMVESVKNRQLSKNKSCCTSRSNFWSSQLEIIKSIKVHHLILMISPGNITIGL